MRKEIPLRTAKLSAYVLWAYLRSKALLSLVGAYFVFSILLHAATGIDICIPCIWSTVFGVHCPGCGLTTAMIHLVQLDPTGAWDKNPLVFFILPAGVYFVVKDFLRFLSQFQFQRQVA
jgi:hypothetical protein